MTEETYKVTSRRQVVELIIEHLKSGHRLDRFSIKVQTEDATHTALCAARNNIKWPIWMIRHKSIKPLLFLIFIHEIRALIENLKKIAASLQENPVNQHLRLV